MIESHWNASVPGRLMNAVRRRWPGSLLGGLTARVSDACPDSRVSGALNRWAGAWGTRPTLFAAFLTAFNGLLYSAGSWFLPKWNASLTGSLCLRVRRLKLWESGFITTGLRYLGVRGLLLLVFALYLPLDWLFRLPFMPSVLGPLWHNALLLGCVLYVLWQRASVRLDNHYTPIDAPMLLFMCVCVLLLCVNTIDFMIGLNGMRATMQHLIWFFVLSRMIRDQRDIRMVYCVMVLMGTVLALHGIYQYIVAAPIPSTWTTHSEMGVRSRAFSIVGSPNILGDLMAMLMPLTVALAYKKGASWEHKLFWWACAAAQGLACVVTFTRGAWLGLAAAALVFIALKDRRLLVILLAAASVAIFIPEIMNRLTFLMTEDFAVASQLGGRAGRREIGLALLRGAGYLLGMGHGRYGGAVAMQNQVVEWLTYHYLDNYYLKTLVETGIVGLSAYLLLVAATLATLFRAFIRMRGTAFHTQAAAILASCTGVLVHCLFENIFEVPYMAAYFWGLAAISCAAVRIAGERRVHLP